MILLSSAIGVTWILAAALAMFNGRRPWVGWIAVAGVLVSFVSVILLEIQVLRSGEPVTMVAGDWAEGVGIEIHADALGLAFAAVSSVVILFSLLYEVMAGVRSRTFPALILFLNTGLMGLFLTGDIFNFYVFFEISMAAAYILTSYREQDYQVRAAFIFAIVNLIGSVVFVIAVAALYHLTGSLDMEIVGDRMADVSLAPTISIAAAIFVAFGLKLGLFPFHFWLPAVYVGSHAPVAAILSGALANIGSYGLLRFGGYILPEQLRFGAVVIIVLGATSIIYGAVQAISRRSPVEVMAYSAIGQVGYILVALAIGGPVGYAAAVLYSIVNSLNKLLVFLSTGLRGPLVGASFAVAAFSIAGVPPAAGFLGKLSLFRTGLALDSLAANITILVLVFVGGALSFVYSFQVYQRIYMKPGGDSADGSSKPSPLVNRILVFLVAGLVVGLGLWPEALLFVSDRAASVLTSGVGG